MKTYIVFLWATAAVVFSAWLGGGATTKPTMDNYSFSVGVWCATRVQHTNWHDWILSKPEEYSQILYDARHFSQTNGWLPFNNRRGFRGGE